VRVVPLPLKPKSSALPAAIANALTVAGSLFPNRLADEVTVHMRDRNKQRIFSIALTMRAEEVGLAHGFVPAN
jgi:hypothetical protein